MGHFSVMWSVAILIVIPIKTVISETKLIFISPNIIISVSNLTLGYL